MKKILFILSTIFILLTGCKQIENSTLLSPEINIENKNTPHIEGLQSVSLVRVIDGDTIVVFDGTEEYTVRLLLIDTPEMNYNNDNPPEPFAEEATIHLNNFLKGKNIQLEFGEEKYDKYNRVLAWVFANGESVQASLLEHGLAKVRYVYEPNTKYVDEYREIENKARQLGLGIWSIPGYADSSDDYNLEVVYEKRN